MYELGDVARIITGKIHTQIRLTVRRHGLFVYLCNDMCKLEF